VHYLILAINLFLVTSHFILRPTFWFCALFDNNTMGPTAASSITKNAMDEVMQSALKVSIREGSIERRLQKALPTAQSDFDIFSVNLANSTTPPESSSSAFQAADTFYLPDVLRYLGGAIFLFNVIISTVLHRIGKRRRLQREKLQSLKDSEQADARAVLFATADDVDHMLQLGREGLMESWEVGIGKQEINQDDSSLVIMPAQYTVYMT
jgi:hypothetical protein